MFTGVLYRQNMVGWKSLRNVGVDDLGKGELATVRHQVEALRLDAGRLHGRPFQVISGGFGIRSGLGLLSNRPDGLGAVDRLFGAGDISQSTSKLLEDLRPAHGGGGIINGFWGSLGSTHAACAHLNMVKEVEGLGENEKLSID